jgi:hypothetical protein
VNAGEQFPYRNRDPASGEVVGETKRADDAHVRAVLGAPTCEHDMVELIAGDPEGVDQAAVGRAARSPCVRAHLARIELALSQAAHNARHAVAPSSRPLQRLVKETEQGLPVALGGGWVEDGQIRNRKAMMGAGICLDQMVHSRFGQNLFEAFFLFFGKMWVFDRTGDIDTPGHLVQEEMRTVGLVGGQIAAVKRRGRRKSIGERAGSGQRSVAAHAIARRSESITFHVGSG